jgi:hypothetical protein
MIPVNTDGNSPGGLWALVFGSGQGMNGDSNTLSFTDGIKMEADGLFGAIDPATPLPAALPLFATGLGRSVCSAGAGSGKRTQVC